MGSIQVSHVGWRLPGGTELLRDVSFSVGDGDRAALVGANGVGKSTLMRLIAGEITPSEGTLSIDGRLGVMRQLVGVAESTEGAPTTVRQLLVSLAPPPLRHAADRLAVAERRAGDEPIAYADALADWGDRGGYALEVLWDECTTRAVGLVLTAVADRPLRTFSGGEQKRMALEVLLRGEDDVLLLDEPDNFLDVTAKRWLERQLRASRKTILYVSHDRELLAATTNRIVTIEAAVSRNGSAWTHGGGFAGYHAARRAHLEQLAQDRSLYDQEHQRLRALVAEMSRRAKLSDTFAPKLKAAETRLRHFLERHEKPGELRQQRIDVRLGGARTGKRAVIIEQLEIDGLTDAFDLEVTFGERVAVLGPNGAGKSHFLRLLAGDETIDRHGVARLGAGVVPGLFHQTHEHPEWAGRTLLDILHDHDVVRGPAMSMLRRYELHGCAEQPFDTLSGGQQARFQILLLERSGATLLLLDEPTDNLDLVSAEALEHGLEQFTGTVVAVTHDRWFLRAFDRFVVFGVDCSVTDHLDVPAAWR
ncbi:MAG: ABC-F family ATP-binding cassette domain-containing protein [Acidimicrobiia bacterium]|nr:ABC-F family ATP-binding cassette domain-containing protein [Acidimicrobiia bacterium]